MAGWVVLVPSFSSQAIRQHRVRGMSLVCNAFEPEQTGMARVLWVFYLSKVLDFLDTVFICLRRKWRQVRACHPMVNTGPLSKKTGCSAFDTSWKRSLLRIGRVPKGKRPTRRHDARGSL